MSSWTRIAPDITTPRPNPGKIYALFACRNRIIYLVHSIWCRQNHGNNHRSIHHSNLSRNMYLAIVLNRIKWTPSCKHCSTLCAQTISVERWLYTISHSFGETVIWLSDCRFKWLPCSMCKLARQYIQPVKLGWIGQEWMVSAVFYKLQ
jgi:hypothetical protein